jgi:hypothetical protein
MPATLLLDPTTWDLTRDASGNIAVASEPYSLAQDAASAIKTFLGEVYFDKTIGIPYLTQILGHRPPLALLKQQLVNAALTVPGIASATVFLTSFADRSISGQVQVVSNAGQISAANFTVIDPQGA